MDEHHADPPPPAPPPRRRPPGRPKSTPQSPIPPNRRQLTIAMPEDLYLRTQIRAGHEGRSFAGYVRRALAAALDLADKYSPMAPTARRR